jgi:hypothetical protein
MSQNATPGWPDDETLVAFADGRLDADATEKVARYLDENEDARLFVERLMTSGGLAKVAYDAALEPRERDAIAELILGSDTSSGQNATSNVVPLARRPVRSSSVSQYALPMAAALALVVGGLGGYGLGRSGSPAANGGGAIDVAIGPVVPGTSLASLLDRQSSGDPVTLAEDAGNKGREFMVVASFRDRQGRVCREFEVLPTGESGQPITAAVACRHDNGRWHVEGAAQVASAPAIPETDFSPASGNDASAIEGILKSIGAKPALSKEDETLLLKGGWK